MNEKGIRSASKAKALWILAGIYALAYLIGGVLCMRTENTLLRYFIFDSAATAAVFVFSVILKNSSVYDAYWSLTPAVMSVFLFCEKKAFSAYQLAFLMIFLLWAVRLTGNWITVFTGFSYEDWRYRKYREETAPLLWPLVNFFGIHYMPTFLVFLGMTPLFAVAEGRIGVLSVFGAAVMLGGIALEFFADRQMHAFLKSKSASGVCSAGLWKYSRHPNYLGEISFWLGVYLAMLPCAADRWYYGAGFVGIALLFNIVSIPLAEQRQLKRRPAYAEYRKKTSRLLPLLRK